MKYSIHQDVFTGMYYCLLLGGIYDNCYGLGTTAEGALMSLKISVNQLKRKREGD